MGVLHSKAGSLYASLILVYCPPICWIGHIAPHHFPEWLLVPAPFWNQARAEFEKIKPVFMLGEAYQPDLHEHAFDMTYAWDALEVFKNIAKGKTDAGALSRHPRGEVGTNTGSMGLAGPHDSKIKVVRLGLSFRAA